MQESKNLVEVILCFGIACHDLQGALYKLNKSHGHATQSIIMSRQYRLAYLDLWTPYTHGMSDTVRTYK